MQILVVEDDLSFAQVLLKILSEDNAVHVVSGIGSAVNYLSSNPADVIVSDFRLQEGDGHQLMRFLATLNPAPPVVMITAFAEKEMAIASINLGVFALLEKPFQPEVLRRAVARALNAGLNGNRRALNSESAEIKLIAELSAVECEGQQIILTQTEFRILTLLISNAGSWVTRRHIEKEIWGDVAASRNVLDTHLLNLKRKVPHIRRRLTNLRGKGYVLARSDS